MGQQVNKSSKVKNPSESDWTYNILIKINYFYNLFMVMDKLLLLDPKPDDLSKTRLQKRIERLNVA
jgi:hypothetical protein